MPTQTWQVGQSSDDCYRRLHPTAWSTTEPYQYAGDSASNYYDIRGGMRVTSINIPQGVPILSAHLKLYASYLGGSIPETFIEGEDTDDAATFSTVSDYDNRTRTSASVTWTPPNWTLNTWHTSPDIKTIIQEIINREGWHSGNALVLFWRDVNGWIGTKRYLGAHNYDTNPDLAAKLEVTWTGAYKVTVAEVLGMVDVVVPKTAYYVTMPSFSAAVT